ncbi:MAG: GDSL-type esterase/lipase family protein [Leptospirales bacterium]
MTEISQQNSKVIAAVGDSITWGYPYGKSWTQMVEAALGISIINHGLNGDVLEGMQYRLGEIAATTRARTIIVMGGTNDVYSDITIQEMIDTSQEIERLISGAGKKLIWGIPVPIVEPRIDAELEIYREWLRNTGQPIIPFDRAFYENNILKAGLLPDSVHPSEAGYVKMAEIAKKTLETLDYSQEILDK